MSRQNQEFRSLSRQDAFTKIYKEGLWGRDEGEDYNSGSGSREAAIVDPYISAVVDFLAQLGRPNVVDLGCGDFAVGSKIRFACGKYVACDVVEPLIERNRAKFSALDVDFRTIDLVTDELPSGDVVMVRQVLQHLSNSDIASAIDKISKTYKYLILTEHVPLGNFQANVDKPAGPGIRLVQSKPSGVVLTEPPFKFSPVRSEIICSVDPLDVNNSAVIRTIAYTL